MTTAVRGGTGKVRADHRVRQCRAGVAWVIRLGIGALAISLVACGSGGSASTPPPAPTPTSVASSAPTPAPASLGPLTPLTADSSFEGYHERNTCEVIGGWVYDKTNPDAPVSVEIFDGATLLSRIAANVFRQDLRDAGKGNGNHSFVLAPPAQLKDGTPHQIAIRIAGTNLGLINTPMPLMCAK